MKNSLVQKPAELEPSEAFHFSHIVSRYLWEIWCILFYVFFIMIHIYYHDTWQLCLYNEWKFCTDGIIVFLGFLSLLVCCSCNVAMLTKFQYYSKAAILCTQNLIILTIPVICCQVVFCAVINWKLSAQGTSNQHYTTDLGSLLANNSCQFLVCLSRMNRCFFLVFTL